MTAASMVPATPAHATRRGRIEYRTLQPGFRGGLWGFEDWRLTRHADGQRVLRSYSELQDEPLLIRDLVQSVDREFHPLEAYVRLTSGDAYLGSGWYSFTGHEARLAGHTAARGRVDETRAVSRAMRGFGTRSLVADAWLCAPARSIATISRSSTPAPSIRSTTSGSRPTAICCSRRAK